MDNVTNMIINGASTEVHNGAHLIATCWRYWYSTFTLYLSATSTTLKVARYHANWQDCPDGAHATYLRTSGACIWNVAFRGRSLACKTSDFLVKATAQPQILCVSKLKRALGLKIHEDWGATSRDWFCLKSRKKWIFRLLFTPIPLNESGFGRYDESDWWTSFHTFHTEGRWRSCTRYH